MLENAEAILLVYEITSRDSFEAIALYIKLAEVARNEGWQIVIVGIDHDTGIRGRFVIWQETLHCDLQESVQRAAQVWYDLFLNVAAQAQVAN
jgi:hypothetical protein